MKAVLWSPIALVAPVLAVSTVEAAIAKAIQGVWKPVSGEVGG
jgi:hypothetical protein